MATKKPAKSTVKESPKEQPLEASWLEPEAEVKERIQTLLRRRGYSTNVEQGISQLFGTDNPAASICENLGVDPQPINADLWVELLSRMER